MNKTITDHRGNEWTAEQLEPFIADALETFGWPVLGNDTIEILGNVIERALNKSRISYGAKLEISDIAEVIKDRLKK